MLTCALCVVPVGRSRALRRQSKWVAVLLVGLAAAAHQGFSANLFTLTSDMFPRRAVGSVVGIGGFAGAIGGFFLQITVGRVKDTTGNYVLPFALAGGAYLTALLVIHLLVPKVEPIKFDKSASDRHKSLGWRRLAGALPHRPHRTPPG